MIKRYLFIILLAPFTVIAQDNNHDVDWGGRIFAQAGYYQQSSPVEDWALPGFIISNESMPHEQGIQLFHGEVAFFATLEQILTANIVIGSHGIETPEIEELWLQPWITDHATLRIGRQLLNIGLYNGIHDHEWRFIDATLSQVAFLGGQYSDDAIAASYDVGDLSFSGWIGRGDTFPASSESNSAKPNAYGAAWQWLWLGENSSFMFNNSLSYFDAIARSNEESGHHTISDENLEFTGDTRLLTLGVEWQLYDGGWLIEWMGAEVEGKLTDSLQQQGKLTARYYGVSSEWFWRWETLETALRYEMLVSDNQVTVSSQEFERVLDSQRHNPQRISGIINWHFAQYQQLRIQANYEQLSTENESALWLVYQGELTW